MSADASAGAPTGAAAHVRGIALEREGHDEQPGEARGEPADDVAQVVVAEVDPAEADRERR